MLETNAEIAADLRAVRSVSRMEVTPGRILRPV